MNILLLLVCTLLLASCAQLDDTLGVAPEENAFQCITLSVDGYFTDSNGSAKRFEMPSKVDVTHLTPEQIDRLAALASQLGCAK